MSRITGADAKSLMEAYNAVYAPQVNEDYLWESYLTEEFISESYQIVADYLVYNGFVPGYNTAEVYMSEMAVEDIDSILFETGVLDEEYLMEAGFFQGIGAGADRFVSGAQKNIQGAASNVQRIGQTAVGSAQRLGTAAVGAVKTNIANKVKAVQGAAGEVQKRVTPVAQAVQGTAQRAVDAAKTNIANRVKAGQAVLGAGQRAVDAAKTDIGNRVKAGQAVVGGVVNSANRRIGQEIEISRKVGAGEPLGNAKVGPKIVGPKIVGTGPRNFGSPSMAAKNKQQSLAASFDYFDAVKGYLIDEGYADTEESATAIMANMSEEWRQSIFEAQEARENPEKYERSLEAKEGRRKRSGRNDPKTGINSPAFAAFMKQQGR